MYADGRFALNRHSGRVVGPDGQADKDAVMAQLLGERVTLTEEDLLYFDNIGNHNRRLDIGDVVVWLKLMEHQP